VPVKRSDADIFVLARPQPTEVNLATVHVYHGYAKRDPHFVLGPKVHFVRNVFDEPRLRLGHGTLVVQQELADQICETGASIQFPFQSEFLYELGRHRAEWPKAWQRKGRSIATEILTRCDRRYLPEPSQKRLMAVVGVDCPAIFEQRAAYRKAKLRPPGFTPRDEPIDSYAPRSAAILEEQGIMSQGAMWYISQRIMKLIKDDLPQEYFHVFRLGEIEA
jgi:hypothetical protein